MNKEMSQKKILVVKNDHIGDMILTTGVFRELKKAFSDSRLVVVSSKVNKVMVEENPYVDRIIVADHGKKFVKNWRNYFKVRKEIAKEKFDVSIDLRGDFLNIFFLMFLSNAGRRIGFYKSFWSKMFLNFGKKKNPSEHIIQNMFDLICEGLGINVKNISPEIFVNERDKKELKDFIEKNKLRKFICICPDASHPKRLLPLKTFDEVIKKIKGKYPSYKILIPGVSERVDWLAEKNKETIPIKFANLKMLYLLFQKAGVVLSLDTGTTPLSWAGDSNLINILLKFSLPWKEYLKPLSKNAVVVWEKDKPIESGEIIKEIDKFLGVRSNGDGFI